MGGHGPHLGLVVTEGGAPIGYSIESRDATVLSNTRDVFFSIRGYHLTPGDSTTLKWTMFWHIDRDDFLEK